jgi:hypothetical protein
MTEITAVLGHGLFIRMIQPNALLVLLDPGLNGMPSLANAALTTFTGSAVDTSCSQDKVILDGL